MICFRVLQFLSTRVSSVFLLDRLTHLQMAQSLLFISNGVSWFKTGLVLANDIHSQGSHFVFRAACFTLLRLFYP